MNKLRFSHEHVSFTFMHKPILNDQAQRHQTFSLEPICWLDILQVWLYNMPNLHIYALNTSAHTILDMTSKIHLLSAPWRIPNISNLNMTLVFDTKSEYGTLIWGLKTAS